MKAARSYVCGLDLSGPANSAGTALMCFSAAAGRFRWKSLLTPANDAQIIERLQALAADGEVALGIDAPLSYNDGGGLRDCDKDLKQRLRENGLGFIGVMPPTLTRMVYITLRGIWLTRTLAALPEGRRIRMVEVHPGAAVGLRGAPREVLRRYKAGGAEDVRAMKSWLAGQGLTGLPRAFPRSAHEVDAAAAALAAWKWQAGESVWLAKAEPPGRPYDFAC